jgi:Tetratricopeptide repeat
VVEVRRWEIPYQTILQAIEFGPQRSEWQLVQMLPFSRGPNETSPLWKGRMYHFKGVFSGEPNAIIFYQGARLSRRELDAVQNQSNQRSRLEGAGPNDARMGSEAVRLLRIAKMDAGYWLGLIHAHQGNNDAAIDYFQRRTIGAFRGGPWTPGAIYNLGRAFEAEKRFSDAIKVYRLDRSSPCHLGNQIRAKWLERLAKPEGETTTAEEGDAETPKTEVTP